MKWMAVFLGLMSSVSADIGWAERLQKVSSVVRMVQEGYVEAEPAEDDARLEEGAIRGVLHQLGDPFTRYIPAQNYTSMQEDMEGGFGGVGITWTREENWFLVISPMEGTPAWKAGIRAGDKIVSIAGKPTKDMSMEDGSNLMKGKVGTEVRMGIVREGEPEVLTYSIKRDFIEVSSVRSGVLSTGYGYIRITAFTATTGEDVADAVRRLERAGDIEGLVLDLRGNPGGLLDAAVEVAQVFLPEGSLVVSIKNRQGVENRFESKGKLHKRWPMTVLIDNGSASASEIVAGALKDSKRGLLIGSKSFGKGSVQTVLPLGDGSAVALTTAYYYTPAGIRIHKIGIEPDVKVTFPRLSEEELKAYREELLKQNEARIEALDQKQQAELQGEGDGHAPEMIPVSSHDQPLSRALEILKAVSLYTHGT